MGTRAGAVLVVALALATAGCGSTTRQVTTYAGGTGGSLDDDGSPLGPDGVARDPDSGADTGAASLRSGGAGGVSGTKGGGAGGTTGGGRRGAGSAPGSGGSSGGGTGGDSSSAPGVTDTAVKVGVVTFENTDEMTSKVSPTLGLFGDFEAYYRIAIENLNNAGGVLGRKVEPVYRQFDSNRTDTDVQAQANCDALTRDTKVFAVLAPSRQTDTFKSCIERAGVVYSAMGGATPADERMFTQFPHYTETGSLNLSRLSTLQVDHLVAEGFLTPSSVIGVATFDSPSFRRAVDRQLKPALARHGLQVKEQLAAPLATNSAETGATSTAVKTGVLRFNRAGVDRVLFVQNGVTLPLLFMTEASSQQYLPRYALNSSEAPPSLQGSVSREQFEGAIGIGWMPTTDVHPSEAPVTPQQQACTTMMERGGQQADYRTLAAAMYVVCDHVAVFGLAMDNAGRPHRAAFVTGLEALSGYTPAATFALKYGPGRHDGVGAVRALRYDSPCNCFRYAGGPRPV